MKIKIGQIVKANHIDDNGKKSFHPFLIVNISKKNIFGVQCASVKEDDNHSYFSRNNIDYYELKYYDSDYVTHVRTDYLEIINNLNIKSIECEPSWKDYNRVAQELLLHNWENNEFLNQNEIYNHIYKGLDNFSEKWEI